MEGGGCRCVHGVRQVGTRRRRVDAGSCGGRVSAVGTLRSGVERSLAELKLDGVTMAKSVVSLLDGWSVEDLANLSKLLGMEEPGSVDEIIKYVRWRYHSQVLAESEAVVRNTFSRVKSAFDKSSPEVVDAETLRPVPSYDDLLVGACKHVGAFDEAASLQEHEAFLLDAIILGAVQRMTPRERRKFFETPIDPSAVAKADGVAGADFVGPAATLALLGAAQATGFGVYLAATTALGLLTHAVGVTLPFAVYSGVTSTIAFLIGPVGWLTAGVWGAWKLTATEWKSLTPALVYIICVNTRRSLQPI